MKVALVHDWLTGMRGGERCLEAFIKIYPEADIFTLIHIPGSTSKIIDQRVKKTSFLNKLPGVKYYYRWLLPVYPLATKSLKIEGYDLVVSLSHAVAKNINTPKNTKHISYCFTPMRYIWDQSKSYFGFLRYFIWPIIKYLRAWDLKGSAGVDRFVVISRFVAARIRCFYHRQADVIYPPISQFWFTEDLNHSPTSFYLYAGALVPYKNVDQIIEAFNQSGKTLLVAGTGPLEKKLKTRAGSNIKFLGRVSDARLKKLYQQCSALIFAAKEDFGLIPVECLATGRPVIAPYAGALKESLNNAKYWENNSSEAIARKQHSGVFFRYNNMSMPEEINLAINFFEENIYCFDTKACTTQAENFQFEKFISDWQKVEADVMGTTEEQDYKKAVGVRY